MQLPAIFLVSFIPMLLVALGYRELNNALPDAGSSFTWATRAFGPCIVTLTMNEESGEVTVVVIIGIYQTAALASAFSGFLVYVAGDPQQLRSLAAVSAKAALWSCKTGQKRCCSLGCCLPQNA